MPTQPCLYEVALTVNWPDLNLAESRVHSHVQSSICFFTVCDVVYAVVAHFKRGFVFVLVLSQLSKSKLYEKIGSRTLL